MGQGTGQVVTIDGKNVKLSNLDKVMYPKTGFTKAQVIDYYRKAAKYILPHIKDRAVTLKRYPDGVDGEFFYEKQCPSHRPKWVETFKEQVMGKDFCLINDLASLVWSANLANLEMHTLLAKIEDVDRPTMMVFDLDPGQGMSLLDCAEVALVVKQMLEGVGLESFAKVSGGKGLHLHVPLNTPVGYDETKQFARTAALIMEKHYPEKVVSKMSKQLRKGKVFIDWSQNSRHKTTAAVYSLRASNEPRVAMPVSWDQIEQTVKDKNESRLIYSPQRALDVLEKQGDIFAEVLIKQQRLKGLTSGDKPSGGESAQPSLEEYRKKRDFSKTPEPSAGKAGGEGIFVIHKHAARRLHYDLRLEADGVLKSWAVPKGPSSDVKQRRLAVQTEDHPFDYKDFEGRIPEGEYGAGAVIIWDQGKYKNVSTGTRGREISVSQAIERGKLEVIFAGEKIRGRYVLVHMKQGKDERNWLLIKSSDSHIGELPEDLEKIGQSVASGKEVKDI